MKGIANISANVRRKVIGRVVRIPCLGRDDPTLSVSQDCEETHRYYDEMNFFHSCLVLNGEKI